MTTTDWRELCAEILTAYRTALYDDDLVLRARAALAQPDPALSQRPECFEFALDFLGSPENDQLREYIERLEARAALAQPEPEASPAPVPAEGEVAELVAWLREQADNERGCEFDECEGAVFDAADKLTRAADLLEQRHPAPVPVAERLPGAEDCDGEGFCWWFSPADPSIGTFGVAACWVLRRPEPDDDFRTHWLPATALPLPAEEVE